jgi:hypothetical protein
MNLRTQNFDGIGAATKRMRPVLLLLGGRAICYATIQASIGLLLSGITSAQGTKPPLFSQAVNFAPSGFPRGTAIAQL